jgi:hypothetical protein
MLSEQLQIVSAMAASQQELGESADYTSSRAFRLLTARSTDSITYIELKDAVDSRGLRGYEKELQGIITKHGGSLSA